MKKNEFNIWILKNLRQFLYFLVETLAYYIISTGWRYLQTLAISLDILKLVEPVLLPVIRHHPGLGALLEHLGTISVCKAFLPLGLVKPKKCSRENQIFEQEQCWRHFSVSLQPFRCYSHPNCSGHTVCVWELIWWWQTYWHDRFFWESVVHCSCHS